ncbi:DUF4179 domain-containing protein [Paenibacillus chartarius]|uniref:DUF4179 domain-containing protein n=1 Tax=Paenibacillus chartarius TaxID=747481 RepID=A0ABV6DVL7_9BACL
MDVRDSTITNILKEKLDREYPTATFNRIWGQTYPERHVQKSKRLTYKRKYGFVLAALTVLILLVSLPNTATLAQSFLMKSVFQFIGYFHDRNPDLGGRTTEVRQSVMDNDVKITISEVYYDGYELIVSYLMETAEPVKRGMTPYDIELGFNGLRIPATAGYGNLINDHQYAGVIFTNPDDMLLKGLPETFDMQITIGKVGYELANGEMVNKEGQWNFTFSTNLGMLKAGIRTVELITVSQDQIQITVKNISYSDSFISIIGETKEGEAREGFIDMEIMDENGRFLDFTYSGMRKGWHEGKLNINTWKISSQITGEIPKSITIRPYSVPKDPPRKTSIVPLDRTPTPEAPVLVPRGKLGSLELSGITHLPDKTLVYYRTLGEQRSDHDGWAFRLLMENGKLVEMIGEYYVDINNDIIVREFPPVEPEQKLRLLVQDLVPRTYLKELEMTVLLAK